MQNEPLTWCYEEEVGPIPDPESLSDERLSEALETILSELEKRGIIYDMEDRVPPRVAFAYLKNELTHGEPFEYTAESMHWHIGCKAYCPDCIQRPWCDIGKDQVWPEDDDAGEMVFPEEARAYMG